MKCDVQLSFYVCEFSLLLNYYWLKVKQIPKQSSSQNPMWLLFLHIVLVPALQVHDVQDVPQCSPHAPGKHLIKLPEVQRQFLLVVPEDYAPHSDGIPLVLFFHGFGDSPWYSNLLVDFSHHINRYGWLGILPFGVNASRTNGLDGPGACCPPDCQGECCTNAQQLNKKDDTACGWRSPDQDMKFVEAILKWAVQNSCVDPHKVFAAGFSMGSMFTNYLACHANHLIRGFAPISGDLPPLDCHISNTISYVSICGTQDTIAHCEITLEGTASRLSALNGCSGSGPKGSAIKYSRSATTSCKVWDACPEQNFVEVCLTEGLAHDVSGHLRPDDTSWIRPASDLDISEYFFQKFSLLVNGTMLFWGQPTMQDIEYKYSKWPYPKQHDHLYIRASA